MLWKDACLRKLSQENLFHDSAHQTRFRELIDCYYDYPFFSPNLSKCMYLSAWDEEHFADLLQILNQMTLGREKNTNDMKENGIDMADRLEAGERFMYELSVAFLEGTPVKDRPIPELNEHYQNLIAHSLRASDVIDSIVFNKK